MLFIVFTLILVSCTEFETEKYKGKTLEVTEYGEKAYYTFYAEIASEDNMVKKATFFDEYDFIEALPNDLNSFIDYLEKFYLFDQYTGMKNYVKVYSEDKKVIIYYEYDFTKIDFQDEKVQNDISMPYSDFVRNGVADYDKFVDGLAKSGYVKE